MSVLGIRVSTHESFGRGHFNRCLEIRRFIKNRVIWFIDECKNIPDEIPKVDKIIVEKDVKNFLEVKKYIKLNKISYLLLDSYKISDKNKVMLSNLIPTALIEDKECNLKSDIFVCPQFFNFKNKNSRVNLIGEKYIPIKKEYFNINKGQNKKCSKLLVSMGAFDSKGISIKILKAIECILNRNVNNIFVNVLIGNESPHIKSLELFSKKYSNILININVENIDKFYRFSDLAIGAPGLSNMERLSAGLPSIIIAQNKYQNLLKDNLVKNGYVIGCKNSITSMVRIISGSLNARDKLKILSKRGPKLIDGKGAKRIAESINQVF
tara:strand:+ start:95 stop:1066 length:972 start_codon:yes stop_codon:yes gene_type:complete